MLAKNAEAKGAGSKRWFRVRRLLDILHLHLPDSVYVYLINSF